MNSSKRSSVIVSGVDYVHMERLMETVIRRGGVGVKRKNQLMTLFML